MNKEFNKFFIYLPVSYIKGFHINKYQKLLMRTQFLSIDEIKKNQLAKLNNIIDYSIKYVPYYKESLKGVIQSGVKKIDDLSSLPFLTKTTLKKTPSSIKSKHNYYGLTKKTTAGSTGEPFSLWKTADAMSQELAATWRGYSWAGVEMGDRQGRFWGVPLNTKDLWRSKAIDFVANRMRCSAFSFNAEILELYTKKLLAFNPKYFYGYVSMLVQYANYFQQVNRTPPFDLKCIVTTSEILSEYDRKLLQNTFNTKVFNEYGSAEVGTIAHECSHGALHVSSENMIVEIVDDERVCLPGEAGEIVITELNNNAMPLIRYKTGDIGSLSASKCPCGRNLSIIEKIEGRTWDMINHLDGRKFHPAYFLYIFEEAKDKNLGISHYKIIQEDFQRFKILIVPDKLYSSKSEQFIQEQIKKTFDINTVVDFECVKEIKREPSGKFRQMVGMNKH